MASPSSKKAKTAETQYDALSRVTTIVADTGVIDQIKKYRPQDATTNPSLIYKAALMPEYAGLVDEAVAYAKAQSSDPEDTAALAIDRLCVAFGTEISKAVDGGYVSTEVDARLSFDVAQSVSRARRIIAMYEANGVPRSRILIKLATTWEGVQAAKILKQDGIDCNMTLLFSFAQAVAAAQAEVRLISPFVGRIRDWWMKSSGRDADDPYPAEEDPGVLSVRGIYNYYKKHGYDTIVMGASFRSKGEITALAGCDRLTIGPKFLDQLQTCTDPLPTKLSAAMASQAADVPAKQATLTEAQFRWMMNEDAMATEKLAEGIRKFAVDIVKLEKIIQAKLE